MPETLPPALPDAEMIDDAVLFINERFAAHVYHGYLEIGQYVLEKFFNNDIALAGSRNGHKPVSYKMLCQRPDLAVSRAALMDMVKTGAQSRYLIAGGIAEERIKYSLLILLTRLENNQAKLILAQTCIDEGLKYEELKLRIREILDPSLTQPVTPVVQVETYLTDVDRWMRKVIAPEGMTSWSYIGNVEPVNKERILNAAAGVLENMAFMTSRIQQMVRVLTQPVPPPVIGEVVPMET